MASITYWQQLQPSPRDASIATSSAACVRDPAWMLPRQWQLGEFAGADAGSPAFARITSRTARLKGVAIGSATVTLADGQLIERGGVDRTGSRDPCRNRPELRTPGDHDHSRSISRRLPDRRG